MRARLAAPIALIAIGVVGLTASLSQQQAQDPTNDPFKGITTNGTVVTGLFAVRSTGVSTAPVKAAAEQFLAGLTAEQRSKTSFAVDDVEWRKWYNVHRPNPPRAGVSFAEMTEAQRELAIGLLRASLSAKGLQKSQNIMRLNGHLGELVNNPGEYTEYFYNITVLGTPSATAPWGWQLDGHHLDINYFVLGDQVVMTPTFMGSEPVRAESGKYAGTAVMQDEQNKGLAFLRALTPEQRKQAVLDSSKTANVRMAAQLSDNMAREYAGLRVNALSTAQRQLLLDLIGEYVGNMKEGHARLRMEEITRHLDQTYFAWVGGSTDESVFYYRIQSPVILIEFDHQQPIALGGRGGPPTRRHVHTVVRTPNGNDYGKDLLRQHYERHRSDPAHGHNR